MAEQTDFTDEKQVHRLLEELIGSPDELRDGRLPYGLAGEVLKRGLYSGLTHQPKAKVEIKIDGASAELGDRARVVYGGMYEIGYRLGVAISGTINGCIDDVFNTVPIIEPFMRHLLTYISSPEVAQRFLERNRRDDRIKDYIAPTDTNNN